MTVFVSTFFIIRGDLVGLGRRLDLLLKLFDLLVFLPVVYPRVLC